LPNCENSIKLTIQLLLDASKGDWSKINILEQIPDKAECFAILASILIERREFDILRFIFDFLNFCEDIPRWGYFWICGLFKPADKFSRYSQTEILLNKFLVWI